MVEKGESELLGARWSLGLSGPWLWPVTQEAYEEADSQSPGDPGARP